VFRQNALAEGIDFAEGNGLEAARALEAQVETADARKERENAQRLHRPHPCA
jgi:hypothetical protein